MIKPLPALTEVDPISVGVKAAVNNAGVSDSGAKDTSSQPSTEADMEYHIGRNASLFAAILVVATAVWVTLRIAGLSFDTTAIILTPVVAIAAWLIPDSVRRVHKSN